MIDWVVKYIGLEFAEKGRVDFFDCWGLVRHIYLEEYNTELPSYLDCYKHTKESDVLGSLISSESDKWEAVKIGCEEIGDVIVLRMRGQPMHVGIVVGDNKFLHISDGINSAIEDYKSFRWRDRVIGYYRHGDIQRNGST